MVASPDEARVATVAHELVERHAVLGGDGGEQAGDEALAVGALVNGCRPLGAPALG